jgi:hypothetical protein
MLSFVSRRFTLVNTEFVAFGIGNERAEANGRIVDFGDRSRSAQAPIAPRPLT